MALPEEPYTRVEQYLARLAGQNVDIPDYPITRIECYLDYLVNNGGGAAAPNAGAHNAIFRGQSLGNALTDAQVEAIASGTFDDIFVGDYWEISGRVYRVAGLDVFLTPIAATPFATHHAVVVPDRGFYLAALESGGDISATGYAGCSMRASGLNNAKTSIRAAFANHIVEAPQNLVSAVAEGAPSAYASVNTGIELMTESQVFGRGTFGTQNQNGYNVGAMGCQFPLFALAPQYVASNARYWIADCVNASTGVSISANGLPYSDSVTSQRGVRPYALIGDAS